MPEKVETVVPEEMKERIAKLEAFKETVTQDVEEIKADGKETRKKVEWLTNVIYVGIGLIWATQIWMSNKVAAMPSIPTGISKLPSLVK